MKTITTDCTVCGREHDPTQRCDVAALVEASTRAFGLEHTHEATCETWWGKNWAGACNCRPSDH